MKNNNFSSKKIDDIDYISVDDRADNQYSIFSTLNFLNRNTDLYKLTRNTVSTIIKLTNSPDVVKDLIEKTNSTSYDNLVEKVKKSFVKPDDNILVNNLAKDVKTIIVLAKKRKLTLEKITNYEKGVTKSPLLNYENSTSNLVKNVTYVYGANRYFIDNKKVKIGQMLPLKTDFETKKEGIEKLDEITKYVKDVYKYDVQTANENIGKVKKNTLYVPSYSSRMDNVVGVLYNVSKNLVGSKNLEIKDAQQIVDKTEPNVFLNSKTMKNNLRKQIFKEHKEEILDVVNTLTTIFMSRFVFDSKYFSNIERDLSEQACVKMQNLVILNNEDYWINELIQDRLKLNCAQILASNKIENVKQLVETYNKNGTKIVNPENIVTLDDLIFSLQYNENTEIKNLDLSNATAGLSKNVKANVKNRENGKVKNPDEEIETTTPKKVRPIKENEKPNAYLKAIRESDQYKKYLEKYQELLKLTKTPKAKRQEDTSDLIKDLLDKLDTVKENTDNNILHLASLTQDGKLLEDNETSKKEVEEIKRDSKHNLDVLNFVANNDDLPDEITDRIADETARNDTVISKCYELLNEETFEDGDEELPKEKYTSPEIVKIKPELKDEGIHFVDDKNNIYDDEFIQALTNAKLHFVYYKNEDGELIQDENILIDDDGYVKLETEIDDENSEDYGKIEVTDVVDSIYNEPIVPVFDIDENGRYIVDKFYSRAGDLVDKFGNVIEKEIEKEPEPVYSEIVKIKPELKDEGIHFVDDKNNIYDDEYIQALTNAKLHFVYYKNENGELIQDKDILIDDYGYVKIKTEISDIFSEHYGEFEFTDVVDSVYKEPIVPVVHFDENGRYVVDKFHSRAGDLVDKFGNVIEKEIKKEPEPVYSETDDGQLSFIDGVKHTSQSEIETLQENIVDENQINIDEYLDSMNKQTFTTQRYVKTTLKNDEEKLKKQFRKYYSNIINGTTTKQGLVESVLNYRIIEKKTTRKNNSSNDVERLDDKDFKKANVIRDNVIEDIVEMLSNNAVKYVKDNYNELDDKSTVEKIGAKSVGDTLEYPKDKNFDRKKLKKVLAVMITNEANKELKDLNVELYTGKRTFKEINGIITKSANVDDGEEK